MFSGATNKYYFSAWDQNKEEGELRRVAAIKWATQAGYFTCS
jgi:hypothetical protein